MAGAHSTLVLSKVDSFERHFQFHSETGGPFKASFALSGEVRGLTLGSCLRGLTLITTPAKPFVTFCCYHRRSLFTSDASRRVFESALERRSFALRVYGYVVMPEHIHLLVSEPERTAPLNPKPGLNEPLVYPLKPSQA